MREIFLSASVPSRGRGDFDETFDPFLIQFAVRELITVCLGRRRIVWSGHPSITPMVQAICDNFGHAFDDPVALYQSDVFQSGSLVPITTETTEDSEILSLMRRAMLSRPIEAAVFVGGMDGIFEEHALYQELHPGGARVIALAAPGGASRTLAQRNRDADANRLDFSRLFHERLGVDPGEPRINNSKP